ncbi:hypothetical protein F5Y11DRAFT_324523 [Daldinia sp. FL1419]|nr:hypothetical protein F5Y11DRAFT_324523 [Daldinia sp. FL1419]
MAVPRFPLFEIEKQADADAIFNSIQAICDYIIDKEPLESISDETENILQRAQRWIPYAEGRLNEAKNKFANTDHQIWNDIHSMLGRLLLFKPKIRRALDYMNAMKKKEDE